jgi:hypothetical protein
MKDILTDFKSESEDFEKMRQCLNLNQIESRIHCVYLSQRLKNRNVQDDVDKQQKIQQKYETKIQGMLLICLNCISNFIF